LGGTPGKFVEFFKNFLDIKNYKIKFRLTSPLRGARGGLPQNIYKFCKNKSNIFPQEKFPLGKLRNILKSS